MAFFDDDLEKYIDEKMAQHNPETRQNLKVACVNWHYSSGSRI